MRASLLDLGPRGRAALSLSYLTLLVVALCYGQLAPDHVFGFQMFNESSSLHITLEREVEAEGGRRLVPIAEGSWQARDKKGVLHTFRWQDRVRTGPIGTLDRFVHASYGLDAQLFRLEKALEDLAAHVPEDRETRAFVAIVGTVRNGRDPKVVRFRVERP